MPKRRMTGARRRQIALWSLKGRKVSRNRYRNKSFTAYSTLGNYPSYRSSLPVKTGTRNNIKETKHWNNKVRISHKSVQKTVLLNKSTIDGSRGYQYYLKPNARVFRY